MKSTFLTIIFLAFFSISHANNDWKAYATVPQLVRSSGYPIETHYVHTSDGYILKLYRIPRGVKETTKFVGKKKAVMLVHGMFGSCDNFIIMGPNRSLAFLLADAGYDVWLANLRGNLYTSHERLTRKDPTFWNYSFEEHGNYDAPAFIDKILNETGLPRVMYVGHSMGATTSLTMLAQRPEYNHKVVAIVSLATATYLDHVKVLANYLVNALDFPAFLTKNGIRGLMFPPSILELAGNFCIAKRFYHELCEKILGIMGEDYEQFSWDMTKILIMRLQPVSIQQISHFGKIAMTGLFTSWEDGVNGRVKPYNLSNVKTPISLWYGENDLLTDKSGILRLAQELNETGTLHSVRPVSFPKFTHFDFVFAKDVGEILNKPLVAHINELYKDYDKH